MRKINLTVEVDKEELKKKLDIKDSERVEVIREQPIVTNEIREVAVLDERKLEAELPKHGGMFRDALELLRDDDRLDKSAIKGLEEDLKRIESLPRGGGTSALGVRQAFKYIFHTEEPVGDIDGANTTYTVLNNIWAIVGFTLNGESIAELPNYTFANKTITFSAAIPSAYSGKDFEIKYIG